MLNQIKALRESIRYHRDQKGDDRCWVDDDRLWGLLPDAPSKPTSLPSYEEMMKRCGAFYRLRRADVPDAVPVGAIQNPSAWDEDLNTMNEIELKRELRRMQEAVRIHRDIQNQERTIEDDRALYQALPERLTADFRLPPEPDFLREARAPVAGCPSFWRSHQNCPSAKHDIGTWGPCSS